MGTYSFTNVAERAKADIKTRATGFADYGDVWNDLTVTMWNVSPSSPNSTATPSPSARVESAPTTLDTSESASPTAKPSEGSATQSQNEAYSQDYGGLLLWLLIPPILASLSFLYCERSFESARRLRLLKQTRPYLRKFTTVFYK